MNKDQETEEPRDSFFQFWKISKEEEKFFKMIYRREVAYRWAIGILLAIVIVLSTVLWLG